jgi:hypothetical protein
MGVKGSTTLTPIFRKIIRYPKISNFLFYNLYYNHTKTRLCAMSSFLGVRGEPLTSIYLFHQQSDDVKKPYFPQYSAVVWEDAPVRVS